VLSAVLRLLFRLVKSFHQPRRKPVREDNRQLIFGCMKGMLTIGLLVVSNVFMTLAWYGHLKFKEWGWLQKTGLFTIILISWGLAFFEYCFQVPANKIGFRENGGPFSLFQLKVIQEVITLIIFVLFIRVFFSGEQLTYNHAVAALLLVGAVFFAFR
jgi:uncharacterized protein (DUF486 family)